MLKHWRISSLLILAMTIGLFISACGGSTTTGSTGSSTPTSGATASGTPGGVATPTGAYTCVQGSIQISGSTALYPLVNAVAKDYQAKCSGSSFTITPNGSGNGLSQAESGAVAIGNSDVFRKSNQPDLVDHQVAIVIFTLVVNKNVTGVTNLTTSQIKGIYSGSIKNWNQVGGPNLPIVIVDRPTSSGTRQTFQTYILGGPQTYSGPQSLTTDTTSTVLKNVGQTSGAIGYAALGNAKSSGLTILNIDGNAPTDALVESNTYSFWNIEHMYTKGAATGLADALINYIGSDQGKQEAANLSFVPINSMQASAIQAHQPKAS